MSIFSKNVNRNKVENFFDVPKDDNGLRQVVEWIKQAEELVLDIEDNNIPIMSTQEGHKYINVYTDLSQKETSLHKGDRFATISYAGLVQFFEENDILEFILLNRKTDSIQLNRIVFTSSYKIQKDTTVQIGQPANPPKAIISFLVKVAEMNREINHIYLALMNNAGDFSFVVNVDGQDAQTIVRSLGESIKQIYAENDISYPVDFVYDDFIRDDEYLIYSK